MHQATVRGFDIRKAVFAWLDVCNRKLKAELLQILCQKWAETLAIKGVKCYSINIKGATAHKVVDLPS